MLGTSASPAVKATGRDNLFSTFPLVSVPFYVTERSFYRLDSMRRDSLFLGKSMTWAAKSLLFRCSLGFSGRNRLGRGVTVYSELRYGIAICAFTPTVVTVYSLYGRLPAPEPQGDGATGGVAGGFQNPTGQGREQEGVSGTVFFFSAARNPRVRPEASMIFENETAPITGQSRRSAPKGRFLPLSPVRFFFRPQASCACFGKLSTIFRGNLLDNFFT